MSWYCKPWVYDNYEQTLGTMSLYYYELWTTVPTMTYNTMNGNYGLWTMMILWYFDMNGYYESMLLWSINYDTMNWNYGLWLVYYDTG